MLITTCKFVKKGDDEPCDEYRLKKQNNYKYVRLSHFPSITDDSWQENKKILKFFLISNEEIVKKLPLKGEKNK